MTVQYLYGTGFEMGSVAQYNKSGVETPIIVAGGKTGDWRVTVRGGGSEGWIDMPDITGSAVPDEIYLSIWQHPFNTNGGANLQRLYFYDGDQNIIGIYADGKTFDAWALAGKVAVGGIEIPYAWTNLQVYIKLANSGGRIITKMDGIVDIDYTGDTLLGSTATFDRIRFRSASQDWFVDDVVYGTGGWLGAIRFEPLRPNGDDTLEWEAEPTGTHYTTVDENAPATADYVSTTGTGLKEIFDSEDFPGAGVTPLLVVQWAYASKVGADDTKLEFILDDGTEEIGQPMDLSTANGFFSKLYETPPSGGEWSDAVLDALLQGYRTEMT